MDVTFLGDNREIDGQIKLDVADVSRPIASVDRMLDSDFEMFFSKKRCCSMWRTDDPKRRMTIHRKNNTLVLEMLVKGGWLLQLRRTSARRRSTS